MYFFCQNRFKTNIFVISFKSSIEWYINKPEIKWCGNFDFGAPYSKYITTLLLFRSYDNFLREGKMLKSTS